MKYVLPNGRIIDVNDNCKNVAERYGGKPVKEKEPKKEAKKEEKK